MNIKKDGNKFKFSITLNKKIYKVHIIYDDQKSKYILSCPQLIIDTVGESFEDEKAINLIKLLNDKQSFRILTTNNKIYANGHFYHPKINFGENYNERISIFEKSLFAIEKLGDIGSEKGVKSINNNNNWEKHTLFNLIDELGKNSELEMFFEDTEILICDDMGTELADFILIKDNKLIFIHVKGKGNSQTAKASLYGASGLSDVINQALKNIYFMSNFDDTSRIKPKKWTEPWININKRLNINSIVNSRIRINTNNLTNEKIWERIEELKYNPNTEKEVWLILGKTFSKSVFISKLKQIKPLPEAIQSAISIKSTIASIGAMGVKTKIFCSN